MNQAPQPKSPTTEPRQESRDLGRAGVALLLTTLMLTACARPGEGAGMAGEPPVTAAESTPPATSSAEKVPTLPAAEARKTVGLGINCDLKLMGKAEKVGSASDVDDGSINAHAYLFRVSARFTEDATAATLQNNKVVTVTRRTLNAAGLGPNGSDDFRLVTIQDNGRNAVELPTRFLSSDSKGPTALPFGVELANNRTDIKNIGLQITTDVEANAEPGHQGQSSVWCGGHFEVNPNANPAKESVWKFVAGPAPYEPFVDQP